MTNFLSRIFIKNQDTLPEDKLREKFGSFAGIVGIIVNIFLSGIKLLAGILAGSIAIIADAVNNLSDAGSSAVSYISFKIAAKPADREHPFGHARIEYIASMIVSFLILTVGFEFLCDSVSKIFAKDSAVINIELISIIILAVSILLKLWLSYFYSRVGKRINSSVLRASSKDSLLDAISTTAVLVSSVIIKYTGFVILDAIVGLGVSAMILLAGIGILNETKNSLLGESPVKETVEAIEKIVATYPEILGIHDMLVHNYGPNHYIASFHAEVDGDGDIFLLHDAIDNVEKEINHKLGILCTVHMDPIVTKDEKISALRDFVNNKIKEIDPAISMHDFRAVIGNTHTNLIFDIVLPYESALTPDGATELISRAVSEERSDHFCVITVDRG